MVDVFFVRRRIIGPWPFHQVPSPATRVAFVRDKSDDHTADSDGISIRYWASTSIGTVGPFRSPNLFAVIPMIPVSGLIAGAGIAGLTQMIGDKSVWP
jgi:hypothetical protein